MWINFKERMPDKSTHVRMAGKDEWEWFDKPVESPQSTTPQPLDGKEESADFGAFMNTKRSDLSGNFKKDFKSQPSQPGEGKKELVTEHGMICKGLNAEEEFELRSIFESVRDERNLYRNKFEELAALKCKPTDGWSDANMLDAIRIGWENRINGASYNSEKWLSSYKAKQTK